MAAKSEQKSGHSRELLLGKCQDLLKKNRPLATNDVTSFGGLKGGKFFSEIKLYMNAPCIGPLTYGENKNWAGLSAFFIFNQAKEDIESHQRFLDWVLCPETSAWRKLVKAQSPQDRDFINKYGYVLDDLNFPANFVGNFLTIFRTPREKPQLVEMWWELVKDGIQPGTAAWICGMTAQSITFNVCNKANMAFAFSNDIGHYGLSGNTVGPDCIERLNAGEPSLKTMSKHLFKDNANYLPCNAIWSDWYVTKNFTDPARALTKFCRSLSQGSAMKRVFGLGERTDNQAASYDDILQLCKALERKEVTW